MTNPPSQAVMEGSYYTEESFDFWDTFAFPVYLSVVSFVVLLVRGAFFVYETEEEEDANNAAPASCRWSRIIIRHLNLNLFTIFAVYCYRDVYPLATYTKEPQDLPHTGPAAAWMLWARIAVLGIASVLIPLFVPREAVDSKHPSPEQTASMFSLLTFAYLDPIVYLAYRVPRLDLVWERLPPLAEDDCARVLRERGFRYLDASSGAASNLKSRQRHLAFGLLRLFRFDLLEMLLCVVLRPFLALLSPLALRELLRYLELERGDGGSDTPRAMFRPWMWIVSLFVSTVLGGMVMQRYRYLSCRVLVRMQALITQLVLEHSLRIRVGPGSLVGKINNLVTTDLDNIVETRDVLLFGVYLPLQVVLGVVFLWYILGWSALVGFATMIVLGPLPGLVARKIQEVQGERMKRTDARVQTITEIINVVRMIKLFGWERKMASRVADKREEELRWIKRRQYLDLVNDVVIYLTPILVIIATFATYAITVLEMLRQQLILGFENLPLVISGKVSLDRVSEFLENTELLEKELATVSVPLDRATDIGFRNVIFTWSRDVDVDVDVDVDDGTLATATTKRQFVLKIEDELVFRKGCVNLVLGETGSGKTSLLMALLSEMCCTPVGSDSWYNLPRDGGVAYAAQESWVQNETIKENIVFGSTFDEERYRKVLYQCALERDISLFEAGDATEVGEKGITLSGGQKARVTLARAIYSNASILLLDDLLAALDVHTAKWIVEKCLKGDLVKGRTVIMTHNVALVRPIAGFVISLKDGSISSQGSLEDALDHCSALNEEVSKDAERLEEEEDSVDDEEPPATLSKPPDTNGKLIIAEEIQEGRVTLAAVTSYFSAMGSLAWIVIMLGACLVAELIDAAQTWFLGYWASQYTTHDASEVSVPWYLTIYSGFFVGNVMVHALAVLILIFGAVRASGMMHKRLVGSILGTTLRWIDTTPVSRIVTRFTQDIRVVDGPIVSSLKSFGDLTSKLLVKFFAVVALTPIFFLPAVTIAMLGLIFGQIYIKAQMQIKRLMSNVRAPVVGHVGSAIAGLASIRAYGDEERVIQQSMDRIDRFTRVATVFWVLNRWIGARMDVLAGLFASGLAAYLVYGEGRSASNTGFALNMAIGFSVNLLYWVRNTNDFEVHGNSLERLHAYSTIEQEPRATLQGKPPAYWPASGHLQVKGLSARYSPGGPRVLHDLSFEIRAGERVGVVGRTGSGKSSLTLSLLRCIPTEGKVYYDGIPTDSLNLEDLRSSVTIIPQMPELLSGTLRQNLDPFEQHDDAALHSVLRAAGLYSLQDTDETRLTLDSAISSGGSNLSVGQRQIIALARALVRGSKVLILDEATSAIDYKTDSIIQTSLRNELPQDITLITIAHRLVTIMDADKILVLEEGRMVEFDTPKNLLERKNGAFKVLLNESNDKALLYSMIEEGL
ncbi:hypothetical protein V5O48_002572 [Marasmius crinis-equi]|uniref:P-loop containing nucleoside triphosphate hydrolase protein n=1 Tax=Marasmius crinis-equi TaxID=585013 RepID=A0ABR3FVF8_9AGAR